ncbi:MAG: branched-chain amino acid ABC transporter permease LivH [Magnetococcales bacterium]|nr:branched-chain amino acid ABC transporter permease LivH [Magnetococcales bacterium]MBF0114355.1 branched-chain amino acid ABC transporter permease LivH [Magnetococcales bacterium]
MDIYIFGQQWVNGLVLGSTYGLIAVGYTMVYGIIGMINFAHGEIYMISAYLTAIFLALLGTFGLQSVPVVLVLVLLGTVLLTALYGWSVERIAYRPLRNSNRLAPLISAIGISLILQNYIRISQGARNQGVPPVIDGVWRIPANAVDQHFVQITHLQSLIVVTAFASMAVLTWIIHHTALGRACRATQQDRVMANLLGVDTDRIISVVFVMGAAMAAVAGMLVTLNYGSFDFYIGFLMGIKAFTAAVLGGIGSLPGAMLGGVVLGLAESFFAGFVNSDYKDVFAFSLLILFLIFRPSGFLGVPEVEKV